MPPCGVVVAPRVVWATGLLAGAWPLSEVFGGAAHPESSSPVMAAAIAVLGERGMAGNGLVDRARVRVKLLVVLVKNCEEFIWFSPIAMSLRAFFARVVSATWPGTAVWLRACNVPH